MAPAAATASNISNFYNRKGSGMNTKNDFGGQQQSGGNFNTSKNWTQKEAVNRLYNKRDANNYEFYQ